MLEVIVIGAGAAGLSAALVLGRSRRRTLVVDDGMPRNAPSPAGHSLFTRDGAAPAELLQIAREQLSSYDTVELRHDRVTGVSREGEGFTVRQRRSRSTQTVPRPWRWHRSFCNGAAI
jgi:thioredoxin reductase